MKVKKYGPVRCLNLHFDLFGVEIVNFITTPKYTDVSKYTRFEFEDYPDENALGYFHSSKDFVSIILLKKTAGIDLLTHEVSHLVMYMLDRAGIPTGPINDELIAYLMGYFVSKGSKILK